MTQQTGQTTSSISKGDIDFINELFKQLTAIKPAWKNAFENKAQIGESKKQWIKGFIESGINDPSMIEVGLSEARRDPNDFMPSVGRFIEWCRPTEDWQHGGQAYRIFEPSRRIAKGTEQGAKDAKEKAFDEMRSSMKK